MGTEIIEIQKKKLKNQKPALEKVNKIEKLRIRKQMVSMRNEREYTDPTGFCKKEYCEKFIPMKSTTQRKHLKTNVIQHWEGVKKEQTVFYYIQKKHLTNSEPYYGGNCQQSRNKKELAQAAEE